MIENFVQQLNRWINKTAHINTAQVCRSIKIERFGECGSVGMYVCVYMYLCI